jgi:hypothetical protein
MQQRKSSSVRRRLWSAIVPCLALGFWIGGCASGEREQDPTPLLVAVPEASAGSAAHGESVIVPSGTVLEVEFLDDLSSETSIAGDRFRARVVEGVNVDGHVAIRTGDEVVGTVLEAVPSKKIGGSASLRLGIESVAVATGGTIPLSATVIEDGTRQTGPDAATTGTAAAATDDGGPVAIRSGTVVGIRLDQPAEVPAS